MCRAAIICPPKGLNLSVGAADYDNDGWPDLFGANDGIEAYLYHNNHNGTFTNVALVSGMALTPDGAEMAAMCISLGDSDNDGNGNFIEVAKISGDDFATFVHKLGKPSSLSQRAKGEYIQLPNLINIISMADDSCRF